MLAGCAWLAWSALDRAAPAAATPVAERAEPPAPADWSLLPPAVRQKAEAAIAQCRAAPNDPNALRTLAAIYHGNFEMSLAAAAYEQALALGAQDAQTPHLLGLIYLERGETAAALRVLELAHERDPNYGPTLVALGAAQIDSGYGQRAFDFLKRAVALDPNEPEAHVALARAQRAVGDLAAAEASLRTALNLFPGHAGAHQLLGLVLRGLGREAEAEQHLTRRADGFSMVVRDRYLREVQRHTATLEGLTAQGRALLVAGRAENAVKLLSFAASTYADRPEAWSALGEAHIQTGDVQAALRAYARARELAPSDPLIRVALARLFALQGQSVAALEGVQHALSLDPDCVEALILQGGLLIDGGRAGEAVPVLERATQRRPGEARGWLLLGTALLALNQSGAVEALERAATQEPTLEPARRQWGLALERAGRHEEALRELRAAAALNPQQPETVAALRRLGHGR